MCSLYQRVGGVYLEQQVGGVYLEEGQASQSGCFILQIYIITMSRRAQVHSISLGITLKQVFIRSKLGGTVTFQIRGDSEPVRIRNNLYQLENQHCAVYQHILLPLDAEFDLPSQNYKPLQITIFVNLDDEQGNSVGGYMRFNPLQDKSKEKQWSLPLELLFPNSTIHFTSKFQVISKKQLIFSKQIISSDPHSSKKSKNSERDYKKSSAVNFFTQNEPPKSYIRQVKQTFVSEKQIPRETRERAFNKPKKTEESKLITSERKYQREATKIASPRQVQIESVLSPSKLNDQLENLKRKIDQQRIDKVRSISKLKMQISPRLLTNEPAVDNDEQKSALKQKIRNLQRKQKNYQISIDDLNSQIQGLKSKIMQSSKLKEDLERALAEKEIKFKNSAQTIKALNEQIESLTSKQRVVNKKGQVKETMLKNQAKRMQQKIKLTEEELNNSIKEKNQLLKTMAELQKKHQTALRQKDLRYNEEKFKSSKQKQEWIKTQKQLQSMIEELKEKAQTQDREFRNKVQRISQLQVLIIRLQSESSEFKEILKHQKNQKDKIQQESQNFQEAEFSSLKKQRNQADSQNNFLKQKLKRLQIQKQSYQLRLRQLEEGFKGKNSDNQKHILRINSLQKDLFSQKQQNGRKNREIQYMKETISSLNSKVNDLKEKGEFERSRRQQANSEFEKHLTFFSKQKEALEIEINDLKWTIIRENDKKAELQQKIMQLNQEILKLNEEVMTKSQRLITFQENSKALELENQNLNKEKQLNNLKIKELAEINKMKQYEAQEQKKSRIRAEQKYEEQRARSNQLQIMNKARESQEEKRQKERENQLKQALKKMEQLEAQLLKKNQESLGLKASQELTLREMQSTKAEFLNVQNELNLLRSENSQNKDEIQALRLKIQELVNQVMLNSEKMIMEGKKMKHLKEQHREFRDGVKLSFENLIKEFFKEESSSNIVATSLIPFPDEALSSIQIQLIQQRNHFIVKHRQKLSDLESQISHLERQIHQQKVLFQNREGDLKNDQLKQREKLKTLIYQTMVEKNNAIEELNIRTSQKQELLRQYEKLKAELIKREDNELQLNGQLQMLLLQYESLKAQNQELNNLVYKYREEEIKTQGEFQEKLMSLTEESNRSLERLKGQNAQKEKKIIDLQRQRMELSEKQKRKQAQKNKYKQQYEKNLDKIKELDHSIIKLSSQSTKLNNTIRQFQLRQVRYKEITQNQEGHISQIKQKIDLLQNQIANLQQQLNSQLVSNQKLKADNLNLSQRLEQIHKLLYEKGEVSKEKIQKKMQQNAQLKTKLIEKQSEISLKQFSLKQREQQNLHLIQEKNQNKLTIQGLKFKIKQLTQQKQNSQLKIRQLKREFQDLQSQKKKAQEMLAKSNFNVYSLETYIQNFSQVQQQLKEKEKECMQLRITNAQIQQNYDFECKNYKETVSQIRKELQSQRNNQRSIKLQHKASLQMADRNNSERYNYLLFQFQREKGQFEKRVEEIETHNNRVIGQLQKRLQRANQHIQELKYNQKSLHQQLARKDSFLSSLRKRLQTIQFLNEELKQKYNKFYFLYEESKSEKQQILKENDQRTVSLINQAKSTLQKGFKLKLTEINRKLQKLRHNEEINLQSEDFSRKQMTSALQRIFSRIEALIDEGESNEGSDSFEVKRQAVSRYA